MVELYNGSIYVYNRITRRFERQDRIFFDDRIRTLDECRESAVFRFDLDGATVVPAFTDCHVHLAEAGYYAGPRSLAALRSYEDFDRAVAAVPRDDDIVYAGQYDDAMWNDGRTASAEALNRHHPDAFAMLVRVDSHSSLVNRKTLAWLNLPSDTIGIERDDEGTPTGRLFQDANWRAIAAFLERLPTSMRRASAQRAAQTALESGIVAVHAQLLGRDAAGYADDIEFLKTLSITVHPKICEADATFADRLGLPYIGGDVFLDGSIGSCTAAVSQPYRDREERGALRFSDDDVLAYFAGAEARGISAGVHAIGDAAIDQCIRTWERLLGGKPSPRGTRHFIEHFEMPTRAHIEACASMNIHLSMQPQFQATWGGNDGMYDRRLGDRYRSMNPLRSIDASGATVCGGSDAPVCPLDPLAGMHAASSGQEPGETLDVDRALALYTVNAAKFGHVEQTHGNLTPGMSADLVVLDGDPFARGTFEGITVLETWRNGTCVWNRVK